VVLAVDRLVPSQYPTIQAAIDAAGPGDTVIVATGRYYENINFLGKGITVTSSNPADPNIVASTIIDANGVSSVVTFANGEGPDAVLTGLTITGGYGTVNALIAGYIYWGGGVYCESTSPTITGNVIAGNHGPVEIVGEDPNNWKLGYGGGIGCIESAAVISGNVVRGNDAYAGGALMTYLGDARISSNLMYDNSAQIGGGVILMSGGRLMNNTVVANSASIAGNVFAASDAAIGECLMVNNIICNALSGGGLYQEASGGCGTISYNNVWGNIGGNYVGFGNQTGLEGNISQDPLFVNPSAYNYHLQFPSPCINAGDPAFVGEPGETDIDGDPRVAYGRVDMGADEFNDNFRPVADAGADQTWSSIPSLVSLDGSSSYDRFGGPLASYHWRQIDGPAVVLTGDHVVAPTFVPSQFGIYVFELIVNDGSLDSLPDIVGIVIGNNHAPVADAGPGRYAGSKVVLDGTDSHDPDGYGTLRYHWRQTAGPTAQIADANVGMPTVTLTQTNSIQRCEFELVVSDGDLTSLPDIVSVKVVPKWTLAAETMQLNNPPFDPEKPTMVGFGGGYSCEHGVSWLFGFGVHAWYEKVNVITFDEWYSELYQDYGDLLIVYLSSVAGDYGQPIQTIGFSAGNGPAIDVATCLNLTYSDPRYAVNRVTLLDAACRDYSDSISVFLGSAVAGEQCWVDNYIGDHATFQGGALNIGFQTNPVATHWTPRLWYEQSITAGIWDTDMYNQGIAGGAYVSVAGPAKNMQLASGTDYYFKWIGNWDDWSGIFGPGHLDFFNESLYPGTLPEPVTLMGPEDGAVVDANGAVLSCEESENAVGYQLLMGPDESHKVLLISDTPSPPNEVITEFPFEQTWWTIKVRDQYGSTVYADPICVKAEKVIATPIVENLTKEKRYGYIQAAIDEAADGDEIVVYPGTHYGNINFYGKEIVVRSSDPTDPSVVAATVINGWGRGPAVTFESGEKFFSMLRGFTIKGGAVNKGNANGDTPLPDDMGTGGGAIACFDLGAAPQSSTVRSPETTATASNCREGR
jgi:hypothetical protein